MTYLTNPACRCTNCPGIGCQCSCAATEVLPAQGAAAAACVCGMDCGCEAAEQGCLCPSPAA
jgi:hypothetical protein